MKSLVALASMVALGGFSYYGWSGMHDGMSARLEATANEELTKYRKLANHPIDDVKVRFDHFDALVTGADTEEQRQEVREILAGKLAMSRLRFVETDDVATTDLSYPDTTSQVDTQADAIEVYSQALVDGEASVDGGMHLNAGTDLAFDDPNSDIESNRRLDQFVLNRDREQKEEPFVSAAEPPIAEMANAPVAPVQILDIVLAEDAPDLGTDTDAEPQGEYVSTTTPSIELEEADNSSSAVEIVDKTASPRADVPASLVSEQEPRPDTGEGDAVAESFIVAPSNGSNADSDHDSAVGVRDDQADLIDSITGTVQFPPPTSTDIELAKPSGAPDVVSTETGEPHADREAFPNTHTLPEKPNTTAIAKEPALSDAGPENTTQQSSQFVQKPITDEGLAPPGEPGKKEEQLEAGDQLDSNDEGPTEEFKADLPAPKQGSASDRSNSAEGDSKSATDKSLASVEENAAPTESDEKKNVDATASPESASFDEFAIDETAEDSAVPTTLATPDDEQSPTSLDNAKAKRETSNEQPPKNVAEAISPLDQTIGDKREAGGNREAIQIEALSEVDAKFSSARQAKSVTKPNRQGRLGVFMTGKPNDNVVRIVGPDSSAKRSGLQPGDQIERIGTQPITEFKDVVDSVSGRAPGDVVRIWFRRDGQLYVVDSRLRDGGEK